MDDPKGHLKKKLSSTKLNGFRKVRIPDHELLLKVDDICLIACAINGLGLAKNSRVRIVNIHRHCVEVLTTALNASSGYHVYCSSSDYLMESLTSLLLGCNFPCVWHTL